MKGEQIFTYPFHQADQTHFQQAPASLYNHLKDFQAQLLQSETVLLKEFKSEEGLKKERLVIGVRVGQTNQADQGCLLLEIAMDAINQIMFDTNRYNGLGESGEAYLVGDDYLMRSSSHFHENSVYNTKVNTTGVKMAFSTLPTLNWDTPQVSTTSASIHF